MDNKLEAKIDDLPVKDTTKVRLAAAAKVIGLATGWTPVGATAGKVKEQRRYKKSKTSKITYF